jgi:hypothetical protein
VPRRNGKRESGNTMNLPDAHANGKTPPTDPPAPPGDRPRRGDLLLEDLRAVLQRFGDAQRKRRVAGLAALDDAGFEWETHEAAAEEMAAARWLADLLLLLLRYASRCRPEALAPALARAAWPELVGEFEDLARRVLAEELPGLLDAMRRGG